MEPICCESGLSCLRDEKLSEYRAALEVMEAEPSIKFVDDRYAIPEAAGRRLLEYAIDPWALVIPASPEWLALVCGRPF